MTCLKTLIIFFMNKFYYMVYSFAILMIIKWVLMNSRAIVCWLDHIMIWMKLRLQILTHKYKYTQETLHTRCRIAQGRLNPTELNDDESRGGGLDDQKIISKPSLLRNRPLMAIIIVYCVFSLQEIAYSEVRELQFTCLQSWEYLQL